MGICTRIRLTVAIITIGSRRAEGNWQTTIINDQAAYRYQVPAVKKLQSHHQAQSDTCYLTGKSLSIGSVQTTASLDLKARRTRMMTKTPTSLWFASQPAQQVPKLVLHPSQCFRPERMLPRAQIFILVLEATCIPFHSLANISRTRHWVLATN